MTPSALVVLAAGAQACPTSDDVGTGVRVDYPDGFHSIITRDASGEVREAAYEGDTVYIYISANGLLETGYEEPENDIRDSFTYSFDTTNMVPPKPWSGQNGKQTVRDKTGEESDRLGFSYFTRGLKTLSIGECAYDSIAVQTFYDNPDGQSMVEFAYLTELGISIVTGYAGPGYVDPQRPTAISRATD